MIGILTDVGLEQNRLAFSHDAAAIDEASGDVTNFGDVRVRRDVIPVRQNKARERGGILFESRPKIR